MLWAFYLGFLQTPNPLSLLLPKDGQKVLAKPAAMAAH